MRRAICNFMLALLLLACFATLRGDTLHAEAEPEFETVRAIPEIVELGPGGVIGQEFTVAVAVEGVSNFSGLDLQFSWNTTYIGYVDHTATIPVEDYPDPIPPSPYGGILHSPKLELRDDVNETAGTYWAAFATLGGPYFSGNGTVFVITFMVMKQSNVDVEVGLNITWFDPGPGIPEPTYSIVNGLVRIPKLSRDVAVAGIVASKTAVGKGYSVQFNVTLENQGGQPETLNLTLYGSANAIITVENVILESLSSITLPVIWNTTEWAEGNYTMSAQVPPVPNETDTADNTLVDDWVVVTIPGDVDGDFDVDIYDIVEFVRCYCWEEPNPNCDIDGDGEVDIYDIVILCCNYGKRLEPL